jgi:hypothetical protein
MIAAKCGHLGIWSYKISALCFGQDPIGVIAFCIGINRGLQEHGIGLP